MNLEAARALKERIRRAMTAAGPAPFGTGISLTDTAGEFRIAVLLTSDRDRRFLEHPDLKQLLKREGNQVDVEIAGAILATGSPSIQAPEQGLLRIGASIGHQNGGVGSLGFFAARRSDGKRGVVSCNHVIAMVDEGQDGDAIVSPSTLDGGKNVVASLDGKYPRLGGLGGAPADCAFAALIEGVAYDAASLDGGKLALTPAHITTGLEVTKAGKVTGARPGIVKKIEVDDVWIRYGTIRIAFHDVILVGSASLERFCQGGDSGALVYTTGTFHPVGLLFATSSIGGPHDAGWTWVHPIRQVMAALDVELVNA